MTSCVLKNIIGKAGGPEGMQGFDELDEDTQVGAASLLSALERSRVDAIQGELRLDLAHVALLCWNRTLCNDVRAAKRHPPSAHQK